MVACEMSPLLMWPMGIGTIVALVGVLVFCLWAIQRSKQGHRLGAMDQLRERFARGEIDADEFERRRATLEGSR